MKREKILKEKWKLIRVENKMDKKTHKYYVHLHNI